MSLLEGKLDPEQFNSITLAYQLHEAEESGVPFQELSDGYREYLVKICQRLIDSLISLKIIK